MEAIARSTDGKGRVGSGKYHLILRLQNDYRRAIAAACAWRNGTPGQGGEDKNLLRSFYRVK
jgi:hypothetical protein